MTSDSLAGLDGARDDTGYRFELLTTGEQRLGWIDGVIGGTLDINADSTVKAGGSLDVVDVDGIDWLHARVRPWCHVGAVEWPLGMLIPAAPKERWSHGHRSWTVELLGKLTTLDTDFVPATVAYPAGTVGTVAVREQIATAGQTGVAVTDSDKTLSSTMVWPAGTSRLTIINDILAAIGYWSLSADGYGRFRAAPYVRPAARPVRYELLDGERSIYADEFDRDRDVYSIPNRVVLVGQGDGDTEALVGVAENTNPDSPFSIPSRGFVKGDTEAGIEAADQATINALARRRLIERSSATAAVPLQVAPIPLDPNDVVRLRRTPAGIDARHTVQGLGFSFANDGTDLMSVLLREVQDL